MNALNPEVFKSKNFDKHLHDFITPVVEEPVETGAVNMEVLEVEFNDKTYFVNPDTKVVYEQQGEVSKKVGMVGALEFADMEI